MTAIAPFLVAYYLLLLAAVVLAWVRGGHPERLGAAMLTATFALASLAPPHRMWNVDVGDAALDLILTGLFAWQALTGRRWWPLAATAVMTLTLMVHGSMFMVPEMSPYTDVSARIGLGILLALSLMAGVGERWLAGERAVGPTVRRGSAN